MSPRKKGNKVPAGRHRRSARKALLPTPPTAPTFQVSTLPKLVQYVEGAFSLIHQVRVLRSVYNSQQSLIPVISAAIASASSGGNLPSRGSKFRVIPTVVAPPESSSVEAVKMSDSKKKMDPQSARSDDQEDDDIAYLYSVDTSPTGRITEEVDLSEESENIPSNSAQQSSIPSGQNSRKRKRERSNYSSRKRSKSRSTTQPRCTVCKTQYDVLAQRNEDLCQAKCGHLFCVPCTREPQGIQMCGVCNQKIHSLCKLSV